MPFYEGFVSFCFKFNCCNKFWSCYMFINNFLMLHYFFEHTFVFVVGSVRPVHDEIPFTTLSYIHFSNCVGETNGSPPLCNVFRFCPNFPYQFYWCVKHSCE